MTLTESQQLTILRLYQILDLVGLVFVTVVLVTMTVGRRYRIPRFQYVYILFVCFWLQLVVDFPSNFDSPQGYCYFWYPCVVFLLGATWLWEVTMAVSVYRLLVHAKHKKPSFMNHWMIWTLQTFLTAFPAITSLYTHRCSSYFSNPQPWQMVVTRLVPLVIYMVVVLLLYTTGAYHFFKQRRVLLDSKTKKALVFLCLYPLIFLICWLPAVIRIIYNLATGDESFPLVLTADLGNLFHPILSSLIFLWPTAAGLWHRVRDSIRFRLSDPANSQNERMIRSWARAQMHPSELDLNK